MKELIYKEIEEGEAVMHWWLGFAWRHWNKRTFVVLPIPFNHLARWIRDGVNWLRQPRESRRMLENYRIAYKGGYDDGVRATTLKWEKSNEEIRAELLAIKTLFSR